MVGDDILQGAVESVKDVGVGWDNSRLHTITSCEVLRGNDRHFLTRFRLDEDNLGMVIGQIGMLNDFREERP